MAGTAVRELQTNGKLAQLIAVFKALKPLVCLNPTIASPSASQQTDSFSVPVAIATSLLYP
jgi:hypothetical protein